MLSLHAYLAGGGSMANIFLRKANFFLQQRNIFYLTIMVVETLRMVPPSQSQIKSNYQPNKLISSDEIHMIIQEPDTQDVHNRGYG